MNKPNEMISDYTECPMCVSEKRDHRHASGYFNFEDSLWAICAEHKVRWYVTRCLFSTTIPDLTGHDVFLRSFLPVAAVYPNPAARGTFSIRRADKPGKAP